MDNQQDNINKVISALAKVPEKRLLIIEIANQIPLKFGDLDYDEVAKRQPEINLAIAEAKAYGAHTIQAVEALIRLQSRQED